MCCFVEYSIEYIKKSRNANFHTNTYPIFLATSMKFIGYIKLNYKLKFFILLPFTYDLIHWLFNNLISQMFQITYQFFPLH